MLARRRRRRPNIKSTLGERLVFAGYWYCIIVHLVTHLALLRHLQGSVTAVYCSLFLTTWAVLKVYYCEAVLYTWLERLLLPSSVCSLGQVDIHWH